MNGHCTHIDELTSTCADGLCSMGKMNDSLHGVQYPYNRFIISIGI